VEDERKRGREEEEYNTNKIGNTKEEDGKMQPRKLNDDTF